MAVFLLSSLFFLVLTSLINLHIDLVNELDNPTGFSNFFIPDLKRVYDFIIGLPLEGAGSPTVGGGATGSVLANRLSEDPGTSVLLIEAGSDGTFLSEVPVGIFLTTNTQYDWKFLSEPQSFNCLGFVDGRCRMNRGKALGGSTILNALAFVRGNRKDFDLWESLGNEGWGYEDVLPYFRKLENIQIPQLRKDGRFHGTQGPLPVSYPSFVTPLSRAWLQAGKELGYDVVDYNGLNQTGFSLSQTTTLAGKRFSAAKAYLKPIKKRPNLKVLLNGMVSQVLFADKKAIGVRILRHGFTLTAHASKEVILSCGAFGTPQLLMLSGIGPAEELRRHNIWLLQDLPVGRNMESHVSVGGLTFSTEKPASLLLFPIILNYKNYLEFLHKNGKGPLGGVPIDSLAFVNTPLNNDTSWPDIQMEFESFNIITNDGGSTFLHVTNIRREVLEAYRPLFYRHSVHVPLYVNRPRSRGNVRLRSTNPYDRPVITTNWYKDPHDAKTAIEGIKLLMRIMESKPFQEFGVRYFPVHLPGCEHLPQGSDDYWDCYIRVFSWTNFHETGTCRMGRPGDPNAVLDPQLRVQGISNLRVADASIFPTITSGNIQAVCYMVGEKAADLIKKHWGI